LVTAEMAGKESGHYELPQALLTIFRGRLQQNNTQCRGIY
jgi:hypothetical protein